ncbi:MAG: Hemolysin nonfunctional [Candidatus Saccharibacteria bacterium]|nr:Hemolysin nonfunctional [Candidatus Saccharibacteria bacterium]
MKQRLDVLLVERGLAATRTQAQALIMAGQVSADGRRLEKPGLAVDANIDLHVKDQPRFGSRAGDKLASVAETLNLDFEGKVVLDVGSSTGGFTDFALQQGAAKVYCVDVGTAQLAYKLRQDPRVVVMEQTDIREAELPEAADMAVMDVSFISLTKVLEPTAALLKPGAPIVAMAKPQFEAGKPVADKYHGVIPEGEPRDAVLAGLRDWIGERFEIVAEADSKVAGAEGNVERFFLLRQS